MSFVRTVLGDIQPVQMGVTYSHEHIIIEEVTIGAVTHGNVRLYYTTCIRNTIYYQTCIGQRYKQWLARVVKQWRLR